MKQLLKTTSLIGFTELSLVIVSIVRNKYLAISIGPEGFGMVGLLSSFFGFVDIFAGVWLATPTMKYIAEYNSNKDQKSIQKVFDFSFMFVFIVASVVTIICFLLSKQIKNSFLSPDIIFLHFSLFTASYISTSLSSVFLSLFQALNLVKNVVKIRIISSIVNLLTVLILVFFFDLTGFFINILFSSLFLLFLYWKYGRNFVKIRLTKLNLKDSISRKIISFGKVNFILGFVNLGSEYLRRIIIVMYSGMGVLGLFQASFGLTKYLGVITNGANFYLSPKMSESLSLDDRNKALNDYIRLTLFSGTIFSVVAILFGRLAITILYSKTFIPLAEVLYIFIISQFLVSIQMGFMSITVGMAKLKVHSIATILAHILVVIIPLFFISKYGLLAIGLGTVIASIQHILINFIYLKKNIGVRIFKENSILFFISFCLIGAAVLLENKEIAYKFGLILILILAMFQGLKKEERFKLVNIVKNKR